MAEMAVGRPIGQVRAAAQRQFAHFLVVGAFCTAGLVACEFGAVNLEEPPAPEEREVTLRIVTAEADAVAARLGWTEGVPGAAIELQAEDGEVVFTGTTSLDGSADVGTLLDGEYSIRVSRILHPDEIAASADPTLAGFADAGTIRTGGGVTEVAVFPSYRTGLVLSEVYQAGHHKPGIGTYHGATFIEVYNNSDDVQYLDGMLVARGWETYYSTLPTPCSEASKGIRDDVYFSALFSRVPGAGSDFPVEPGGVVVMATDAIDHSVVDAEWPNLTLADFEFSGPEDSDIDNPQVPNVPEASVPFSAGRGFYPNFSHPVLLIAPTDTADLPVVAFERPLSSTIRFYGFPRAAILDFWYDRGKRWPELYGTVECAFSPPFTFERAPGYFYPGTTPRDAYFSLHRQVIGHTEDGRPILQDTRSSLADLVPGDRSPGVVGR